MKWTAYIAMAMLMAGAAFAQNTPMPPAQQTAQAVSDSVKVESVWDLVVKGGPVMIPIGICSLVALTIIVERLVSLRRSQVIPTNFMAGLSNAFGHARDKERAIEYCKSHSNPLGNILGEGLKRAGEPVAVIEKQVQAAGEREVVRLKKYLRVLSVITSVSPLLGLLGTITGMITAFQTVATSAEALGRTELLAKGIYEAMITTAAGLMVAIPTLIAYHGLSAKVDSMVHEIDRLVVGFVETLAAPVEAMKAAPRRSLVMAEAAGDDNGAEGRGAVALAAVPSA